MNAFWDRFAPIGGGIFGSIQSLHGFFVLKMTEAPIPVEILPELTRAFMFGFIGGFAGWAAKKSGDTLISFLKTKLVKKSIKTFSDVTTEEQEIS